MTNTLYQGDNLSRKERFLNRIKSRGKYKYSRYTGLPLRYAGGKSLGVGHIVEHIPDGTHRLVSPFMGGGSVEIACAKELGIQVQAYDIFDILVNYWQVQLSSRNELADRLEEWQPTKEKYAEIKGKLKAHWTKECTISDPLELATHYWFNHNLSYGPYFFGWLSKNYASPSRYINVVEKVRQFQCPHLSVKQDCFEETIPYHRQDFLYCDPPYYLDDGKMFKGIYPSRNFPVYHKGFNHELLRDLLQAHNAGYILSYNDCPTIREWYKDFQIIEVQWQYTLGQGETRIGNNRKKSESNHVKKSHEILIVKE